MLVVGLTGGIASGKSFVSKKLRELGAVVIDADQVAREVVKPGMPAWASIIREFGRSVLNPDGSLDRKKLGKIVFADQEKLKKLNEITHPYIIREIKRLLANCCRTGEHGIVVLDVPLLFEVGLDELVDEVWVVYVDPATQIRRLMERDGLSEQEAMQRISSQMPLEEKARRAHRVIDNRGTPEETVRQITEIWKEVAAVSKG
jgi:dephospho-CoA kinase